MVEHRDVDDKVQAEHNMECHNLHHLVSSKIEMKRYEKKRTPDIATAVLVLIIHNYVEVSRRPVFVVITTALNQKWGQ